MSVHTLTRPSWRCAGCGGDWPCQTRRQELLAEHANDPTALKGSGPRMPDRVEHLDFRGRRAPYLP